MENDGQGDHVVDARGIFGRSKSPLVDPAVLCGSPEIDCYFMNYPKRGKCLIFNHKVFDAHTQLSERRGTDADGARLFCRFQQLGFDVNVHNDCTVKEVRSRLEKVAKENHSENDCFVCCILSHGEQGIVFARDGKYLTDSAFAPFRGDVCPSLAGKPKMFFIQACQGDQLDKGVNVMYRRESADSGQSFRIPSQADFLIVYSTVPGFYSWRNTTHGSWFIQALCSTLEKYANDMDLLHLLTIVNRRVAYDFESYTPHDTSMHLKKQIPCITSTLTKKIILSPKT